MLKAANPLVNLTRYSRLRLLPRAGYQQRYAHEGHGND